MKQSRKKGPNIVGGRVPSLKPMSTVSSEINPRSFNNKNSRTWIQQDRGAKRKGLSRSGRPSNARQGNNTKRSVSDHRQNNRTVMTVKISMFPKTLQKQIHCG